MKRKPRDQIQGKNPWDIDIAYCVAELKLDPAEARAVIAIGWMWSGDLRPLAECLWDDPPDERVLYELIQMINKGRLIVKFRRGRPTEPAKHTRNLVARILYEKRDGMKSAEAIEAIADQLGMSVELVRSAIRGGRKSTN
jgi:hypothetical protein